MDAPTDDIFSLLAAYKKDERLEKINGGIGVIVHDDGAPCILPIVKKIATSFPLVDFSYLPITGYSDFIEKTLNFCLGDLDVYDSIVAQGTCGGTNALSVWAQIVGTTSQAKDVIIGTPTWNNHLNICITSGLNPITFPWIDTKGNVNTKKLHDVIALHPNAWILLQANTHNPTGLGLNKVDLESTLTTIKTNNCSVMLDMAYIGLGDSIEADRDIIQLCIKKRVSLAVAFSYSKIMSLYQHRTGVLWMYNNNQKKLEEWKKLLPYIFRVTNSNPPAYGEYIVKTILSSSEYQKQWVAELNSVRNSINNRRSLLYEALVKRNSDLKVGKGLYALLPLSPSQIVLLREEFGIYLLNSGRINIGGLSVKQIKKVAQAINQI